MTSSNNRPREDSWLKSLFVRKVDPRKDAHSNLLAKKETSSLYKLQFHNVKPECLDAYNKIWGPNNEILPNPSSSGYKYCLPYNLRSVKRYCQRFMKINITLALWWGLGIRGMASRIKLSTSGGMKEATQHSQRS